MNKKYNKDVIRNLCRKYGFKYKIISNNQFRVVSTLDNWIVKVEDNGKIRLFHDTRSANCHHQRDFKDLYYMFRNIYEHDKYKLSRYSKIHKISQLLKQIN